MFYDPTFRHVVESIWFSRRWVSNNYVVSLVQDMNYNLLSHTHLHYRNEYSLFYGLYGARPAIYIYLFIDCLYVLKINLQSKLMPPDNLDHILACIENCTILEIWTCDHWLICCDALAFYILWIFQVLHFLIFWSNRRFSFTSRRWVLQSILILQQNTF